MSVPSFIWHEPRNLQSDGLSTVITADIIIHLKGFASGIDHRNLHNLRQKTQLIEAIRIACKDSADCAIVFDGDSYHPESYTYLLALIPNEIPAVTFQHWATVLSVEEAGRFETSWQSCPLITVINVIPVSHIGECMGYDTLGIHTLLATKSTMIFCVGGGACIQKEEQEAAIRGIQFHRFDFIRILPDRGIEQTSECTPSFRNNECPHQTTKLKLENV